MISWKPQVVPFVFTNVSPQGLAIVLLEIFFFFILGRVAFLNNSRDGRSLRDLSLNWGASKWISSDFSSFVNFKLLTLILINRTRKKKTNKKKNIFRIFVSFLNKTYHRHENRTFCVSKKKRRTKLLKKLCVINTMYTLVTGIFPCDKNDPEKRTKNYIEFEQLLIAAYLERDLCSS